MRWDYTKVLARRKGLLYAKKSCIYVPNGRLKKHLLMETYALIKLMLVYFTRML
jgi:hypothetical protein